MSDESMIERVARAIADGWHDPIVKWNAAADLPPHRRPPWDSEAHIWLPIAMAAIEAMREPNTLEAACRAAADPRTGYICWEGVSVHRAADVVDAVLGAALGGHPKP